MQARPSSASSPRSPGRWPSWGGSLASRETSSAPRSSSGSRSRSPRLEATSASFPTSRPLWPRPSQISESSTRRNVLPSMPGRTQAFATRAPRSQPPRHSRRSGRHRGASPEAEAASRLGARACAGGRLQGVRARAARAHGRPPARRPGRTARVALRSALGRAHADTFEHRADRLTRPLVRRLGDHRGRALEAVERLAKRIGP